LIVIKRPSNAIEEAARWRRRLAETHDPAVRREFDQWCAAEPANRAAYAKVEASLASLSAASDAPPLQRLASEANNWMRLEQTRRRTLTAVATIAAVVIVVAAIALGITERASYAVSTYQTGPGERISAELSDGSLATIDSNSVLRVLYNARQRRLELRQGHALFQVAKGQRRPFVLKVGNRLITAHGTTFDVLQTENRLRVALVEGVVSVDTTERTRRGIYMAPSEVLVVSGATTTLQRVSDINRFTAWRDRILIFENARLSEAILEVNRYLDRPIVLRDGDHADLRLSGAFHAGDSDAFVDATTSLFGLSVTKQSTNIVLGDGDPQRAIASSGKK
jgi:transmembrane sensor